MTVNSIVIEYKTSKGYDAHGCLNPNQTPQSKYYANIQYSIRNSGPSDFNASSGFVGYAACGTPAILGFLDLKIEGGIEGGGNPYPIMSNRFATCVIDDSSTTDAAACVAGGSSTDFTTKPSSPSMVGIIKKGDVRVESCYHGMT